MIKGIETRILTAESLGGRTAGRKILKAIQQEAPGYAPERFNNYEPIDRPFHPNDLDQVLDHWKSPFLWRRKRPRLLGRVGFGYKGAHNSISVSMSLAAFDAEQTLNLIKKIESEFGIALAYIHVRTALDTEDIEHYKKCVMPFQSLTTHDLREGLPGLSWAMFFGQPYVILFGDRLYNAPAFALRKIGAGVYMQLTEKVTDVARRRDAYLEIQTNVQQHLNCGAFRGTTSSGKCRVPRFQVPRP